MGTSNDRLMNAYRVEVVRSGQWWAIKVPQLEGVYSQCRRLDQVAQNAREAIGLMLNVDEREVGELEVVVTPPDNAATTLRRLEASSIAADEANRVAITARQEAIERLRAEGLPLRDIGQLVGISHQRVSQLLSE